MKARYYRRADGKWVGAVSLGVQADGKLKRKCKVADTRKDISDWLKLEIVKPASGIVISKRQTFAQFLGRWLADCANLSVQVGTYDSYEHQITSHIIPALGGLQLFFLRREDTDKAVVGKPELPEPWSSYVNASSIKAAVTKVESQDKQRIYTVNKGTADGVRVGMYFVGENTEPDYDNLLLVILTKEASATLKSSAIFRAANYQLGDVLITKIP